MALCSTHHQLSESWKTDLDGIVFHSSPTVLDDGIRQWRNYLVTSLVINSEVLLFKKLLSFFKLAFDPEIIPG